MDRYSIILGKESIPDDQSKKATFGFDQLYNPYGEYQPKPKSKYSELFQPDIGVLYKAGIIYEDPKYVFASANVHFNRGCFLCKSQEGVKEICCNNEGPVVRFAVVMAIYRQNNIGNEIKMDEIDVKPWTFGKVVLRKLIDISSTYPLATYDFTLKKTTVSSESKSWIKSGRS